MKINYTLYIFWCLGEMVFMTFFVALYIWLALYKEQPELVDAILTSEHFSKSKPDPECFLKGMEVLEGAPESTIVFEDSIHGINAGRASRAKVIGLATTNKSEVLTPLCDMVINDFTEISLKDITALLQQ